MSRRAWIYVWGVLLAGVVVSGQALPVPALSTAQWLTFAALTALATCAQLFKAEAPNHQSYHTTLVFFFAGVLLLPPFLFVLLVATSHLIEWAKERWVNSPKLRNWYLQPFNVAVHILAGSAAGWLHTTLKIQVGFIPSSLVVVTIAALVYVVVNHFMVGLALVLARGVSWRQSGILDVENLVTDLILLCLGAVSAVIWSTDPWLVLLALSPLVFIYRALAIPQLKEQARMDVKTGLWNARHFVELYRIELERAVRFDRPLCLIMADLDLLRNINNTYGHLAGDRVLAGVGRIIRENVRPYDVAGRFGGEEFTIVLPETELDEARLVAERLRQAVEATDFVVNTSPTPIWATISVGIAAFPQDAAMPDDLIHQSDIAVYQAKLNGRNCVVSISEVPQHIKLEGIPTDRLATPSVAEFIPRPTVAEVHTKSDVAATAPPVASKSCVEDQGRGGSRAELRKVQPARLWWLVGGVIAAGILTTVLGFALGSQPDPAAIGLLTALAVVAELTQLNLYGEGSVSVSVAVAFAAALIAGVLGVAFVSVAISLTNYLRRRPHLYKTAFNWGTHVLAGIAPVAIISSLAIPLQARHLPLLALPAAVAALAYYAIDTGLIATAVGLSGGRSIRATWRNQFQWLLGHYLVLCMMGLMLSIAYRALGTMGVIVFALPVLMMRYAQKQYVERTSNSVRELKRMNEQLALANRETLAGSGAIQGLNEKLTVLNDALFSTLAQIIDARDPYVSGHSAQVAKYAAAVAMELGLPAERVERIRQAGLLHDIGKIGVSEQVLHKPGRLTKQEYEHVKTHSALGAEFLEMSQGLRHLVPFVRHHHERWDGNGYPDRLRGGEIPLEARILGLCDAVEAMASDRPYRRALTLDEIVAEVKRCAGTQFEPALAEAFARIAEREGEHLVVNSAREVVEKRTGNGLLSYYGELDSVPIPTVWSKDLLAKIQVA